jgi:hypothetical protein
VKLGFIIELKAGESAYLLELDVRKTFVVSISQSSEELRLYDVV